MTRIYDVTLIRTLTHIEQAVVQVEAENEEEARKCALELAAAPAVVWTVSHRRPDNLEVRLGDTEVLVEVDEEGK